MNLSAKKMLLYRVDAPVPFSAGVVVNVVELGVSKTAYVDEVVVLFPVPAAM